MKNADEAVLCAKWNVFVSNWWVQRLVLIYNTMTESDQTATEEKNYIIYLMNSWIYID